MQYTEGQIGRVFVVRIDDGEDMLLSLRQFILDKNIQAGSIHFLGALMSGRMVTGPRSRSSPRSPILSCSKAGGRYLGSGPSTPGRVARISIIMDRLAGQAMPSPAASGKKPLRTSSSKRLSWSLPVLQHDGNSTKRCNCTFLCSAPVRRQPKRNLMKKFRKKKRTRAQALKTDEKSDELPGVLLRLSGTSRAAHPVEIPRCRCPDSNPFLV